MQPSRYVFQLLISTVDFYDKINGGKAMKILPFFAMLLLGIQAFSQAFTIDPQNKQRSLAPNSNSGRYWHCVSRLLLFRITQLGNKLGNPKEQGIVGQDFFNYL